MRSLFCRRGCGGIVSGIDSNQLEEAGENHATKRSLIGLESIANQLLRTVNLLLLRHPGMPFHVILVCTRQEGTVFRQENLSNRP